MGGEDSYIVGIDNEFERGGRGGDIGNVEVK